MVSGKKAYESFDSRCLTWTGSRPLSWAGLIVLIRWFGLCMGMGGGRMNSLRRRLRGMWSAGWTVDVVLSHTVSPKYEPVEVFMAGVDQSRVDKSTEEWLDRIEDRLDYGKWYCGHYHTE